MTHRSVDDPRGRDKAQSNLHEIPWPGRNLSISLVSLALMCTSGFAASRLEETAALFQAVLDAAKAIQHPTTGRGSATVTVDDIPLDSQSEGVSSVQTNTDSLRSMTFSMDFAFKGSLSRSTRSTIQPDGQLQPRVVWVAGEKCDIIYNYSGTGWAVVQRDPQLQFYRKFGYDFHPDTFMGDSRSGLRLPERIERLLAGPSALSTRIDGDRNLHLIAEYRSQGSYEYKMISVDPAKGYRPTAVLENWQVSGLPGTGFTWFTEIHWAEYGSTWYVKGADWSTYEGIHSWEDKPSLSRDLFRNRVRVEITEFHPDVEIADSDFTLAGLHLPSGTPVIDKISGTRYRIGEGLQTAVLEDALAEAAFPQRIRTNDENDAEGDKNAAEIASTTDVGDKRTADAPRSVARGEDEATVDGMANPAHTRQLIFVLTVFAGIAFLLLIGERVLRVRKGLVK